MRIRPIILALLILSVPSSAFSEIYKWTDAEGKLWFTDNLAAVPFEQRLNLKIVKEVSGLADPVVDRWSLARRADPTPEPPKASALRGVYVKPAADAPKKNLIDERGGLRRSKAYYLPTPHLGPGFSPPNPHQFQREIQVREQIIRNLAEKLQPPRPQQRIIPRVRSISPAPQGSQPQ